MAWVWPILRAHRSQGVEEPLERRRARPRRAAGRAPGDEAARKSRVRASHATAITAAIGARMCATPAPTRRSRSALATPAAMRRAFEKAHTARFGFVDRGKAIDDRSGRRRGHRRRGAFRRAVAARSTRRAAARAGAARRASSRTAPGATPTSIPRETLALGAARRWPGADHRAASDDRRRGRLAGRDHREEPCRS